MKLLTIIFTALFFQTTQARVDIRSTTPVDLPRAPLDQSYSSTTMQNYIPLDMEEGRDAELVALRIGDQSLQTWFRSPEMQNTRIVQTANTVEQSMKTEVELQSKNKESVNHKFSFSVQALQTKTRLQYTGWLNAAVNYDIRLRKTIIEITEKIWSNKDFVISHSSSDSNNISSMGLRWNW